MSKFYDVGETLTSLGTGEALVTVLSARGTPTALAATRLIPPDSRMAGLEASELQRLATGGQLYAKYAQSIDRESAHEMITARIAAAQQQAAADTQAEGADIEPIDAKETAKQARAEERARRQAERDRIAEERARNRMLQTVVTSGTRLSDLARRFGPDSRPTRHVLRRETLVGRPSAHGAQLGAQLGWTERFGEEVAHAAGPQVIHFPSLEGGGGHDYHAHVAQVGAPTQFIQ